LNKLLGVTEDEPVKKVVIYARVSSHEQRNKGDLDRQVEMVKEKLKGKPFSSIDVILDVGSGLNDKRKGLRKVMKMAEEHEMTDLAIRYKDRLTRFGFEYLNLYFNSHNVTIHVLDDQKDDRTIQDELVDDLMSIIASFSGKCMAFEAIRIKC
jgi:putative resolvase